MMNSLRTLPKKGDPSSHTYCLYLKLALITLYKHYSWTKNLHHVPNPSASARHQQPSVESFCLVIHYLVREVGQPVLLRGGLIPLLDFEVLIWVVCLLRSAGAVRQHDVSGYFRIKANECQPHVTDPVVHIIILCSPAIELVTKAIHFLEVDTLHGYCPSKYVTVREVVSEGVDS